MARCDLPKALADLIVFSATSANLHTSFLKEKCVQQSIFLWIKEKTACNINTRANFGNAQIEGIKIASVYVLYYQFSTYETYF